MKQQINLFTQLEPPRPAPKALIAISSLCGATLLCYLMVAGYLSHSSDQLKAAALEAQLTSRKLKIEVDQRAKIDASIDLKALEQQVANLSAHEERLATLIKNLQDPALSNVGGFSGAMTGLARQHVRGISINHFSLTQKGKQFSMVGRVHSPTILPTFMTKLGAEAAFNGMSFKKINILEAEGELGFEVASIGLAGADS